MYQMALKLLKPLFLSQLKTTIQKEKCKGVCYSIFAIKLSELQTCLQKNNVQRIAHKYNFKNANIDHESVLQEYNTLVFYSVKTLKCKAISKLFVYRQ